MLVGDDREEECESEEEEAGEGQERESELGWREHSEEDDHCA